MITDWLEVYSALFQLVRQVVSMVLKFISATLSSVERLAAPHRSGAVSIWGPRMPNKNQSNQDGPRICRECENWDEVSKKIRVHELLEATLGQFEKKITKNGYEPTVAEYVKLLQLGQELRQEDEPREIKVTWVIPDAASESEK